MAEVVHEIDITFFPKGGFLLSGIQNLVAFKAINQEGLGVQVKGVVVNESGEAVVAFRSDYMGKGRFSYTPVENVSYSVIIDGYPEFSYRFKECRADAMKLVLQEHSMKDLIFHIQSNKSKRSKERKHSA